MANMSLLIFGRRVFSQTMVSNQAKFPLFSAFSLRGVGLPSGPESVCSSEAGERQRPDSNHTKCDNNRPEIANKMSVFVCIRLCGSARPVEFTCDSEAYSTGVANLFFSDCIQ